MATDRLRLATRNSPLALQQAETVAAHLRAHHPDLTVEVIGMKTQGDRVLDRSLAEVGGKGLFVKELEQRLLDGEADIAVHSMKDVPADTDLPPGLALPVIVERESPFDAFISPRWQSPDALPEGAVIGTCSLRRASQLLHALPACRVAELRGNVNTRLSKLERGDFDAIVLARAGLDRLGLSDHITSDLDPRLCLPGIGQGALGIECRSDDADVRGRIEAIADSHTSACVEAERAVSRGLGGSCLSPIAGHAIISHGELRLEARVGSPDGRALLATEQAGDPGEPAAIGAAAAQHLLDQGAAELLAG